MLGREAKKEKRGQEAEETPRDAEVIKTDLSGIDTPFDNPDGDKLQRRARRREKEYVGRGRKCSKEDGMGGTRPGRRARH